MFELTLDMAERAAKAALAKAKQPGTVMTASRINSIDRFAGPAIQSRAQRAGRAAKAICPVGGPGRCSRQGCERVE